MTDSLPQKKMAPTEVPEDNQEQRTLRELFHQRSRMTVLVDRLMREVGMLDVTAAQLSPGEAIDALERYRDHIASRPKEEGWFLPKGRINEIQHHSIAQLVARAKGAHMSDVDLRINGQNERHQADWIKHLKPVQGIVETK